MLKQNTTLLCQYPFRMIGGTFAGERILWGQAERRNRFVSEAGWDQKSGVPAGHLAPSSWNLPQKSGGMSAFTSVAGSGGVGGSGTLGVAIYANLSGTGDITADAQLVISMIGNMVGAGTISTADLRAYLAAVANMTGSGGVSGTMLGVGHALADLAGVGGISDASANAIGHMAADITVEGATLTTSNAGAAVWNVLGTRFNDPGTMGHSMNTAGNTKYSVESLRLNHQASGKMFFWNPLSGLDTNDGLTPGTACKTFAHIHDDLVTDYGHDMVVALPGTVGGTSTTENLLITKNYVMLRGPGFDFQINAANDSLHAIAIEGQGVEVSGISVATSATSTVPAIHVIGSFAQLRGLLIRDSVDGLRITGEAGVVTQYCTVEHVLVHHNLGYGVLIDGKADHINLIDCHIGGNVGDGVKVDLDASTHEVNFLGKTVIHNNTGWGVNIINSSRTCIFSDTVEIFGNVLGQINDQGLNTYVQSEANAADIAAATWAKAVEGLTAEEMMRVILAALAGKRAGIGTATETYYGRDGTTPRITLTPDAQGNGVPTVNGGL